MFYFVYGVFTTILSWIIGILNFVNLSPVSNFKDRVRFSGGSKKKVWFHAASVGEVRGILPLIEMYKREVGSSQIFLTTTSETGLKEAKRNLPDIESRFAPLDVPRTIRNFLSIYQPEILIINETEIWPALLHESVKRQVSCVMVNGRISDHTISKYTKLNFFFAPVIKCFKRIFVQSMKDRDRFIAIGADPKSIIQTGSTKYDFPIPTSQPDFESWWNQISKSLVFSDQSLFIAFGSVREEEEQLIRESIELIFTKLQDFDVTPIALLVPRHPERFTKYSQDLLESGFNVVRRSDDPNSFGKRFDPSSGKVIVVDKMGELLEVYRKADICFVGGTFSDVGGHNILEPAYFGKPILVGPNTGNVKDVKLLLEEGGALIEVENKEVLAQKIVELTFDVDKNVEMGVKSFDIYTKLKGATLEIFESCKRIGLVGILLCLGLISSSCSPAKGYLGPELDESELSLVYYVKCDSSVKLIRTSSAGVEFDSDGISLKPGAHSFDSYVEVPLRPYDCVPEVNFDKSGYESCLARQSRAIEKNSKYVPTCTIYEFQKTSYWCLQNFRQFVCASSANVKKGAKYDLCIKQADGLVKAHIFSQANKALLNTATCSYTVDDLRRLEFSSMP